MDVTESTFENPDRSGTGIGMRSRLSSCASNSVRHNSSVYNAALILLRLSALNEIKERDVAHFLWPLNVLHWRSWTVRTRFHTKIHLDWQIITNLVNTPQSVSLWFGASWKLEACKPPSYQPTFVKLNTDPTIQRSKQGMVICDRAICHWELLQLNQNKEGNPTVSFIKKGKLLYDN